MHFFGFIDWILAENIKIIILVKENDITIYFKHKIIEPETY